MDVNFGSIRPNLHPLYLRKSLYIWEMRYCVASRRRRPSEGQDVADGLIRPLHLPKSIHWPPRESAFKYIVYSWAGSWYMTSNMLYTMPKEVASALYVIGSQVGYVAQIGLNHEKLKSIYSVWIYLHSIDTLYVMYTTHKNILYLTTWPKPCSGKPCVPRNQRSRHWCEITWE